MGGNAHAFIEQIRETNLSFYGDTRGRGALKDLQQSFPHTWIYVAELIQNAVDANARTIRFSEPQDGLLVLEHDGRAFEETDVEGICTKGVSTKGAGTVGFMGVGFKAVFRSFETVSVASAGWRFRLRVRVTRGQKFGDQQRDWVGAVLPSWADDASAPSAGMTCRFELRDRIEGLQPIANDFEHVFRADAALLALLAMRGVQLIQLFDRTWVLEAKAAPGGTKTGCTRHRIDALDESSNKTRAWVLFRSEYQPSTDAVRRFLEHRAIVPAAGDEERVYGEAARPRSVELFFPLNDDGFPDLPEHGEAFALLPTALELPFGVHLNADWLLTVTRTEFMDVGAGENCWQDEIRDQIPVLLAAYLEWLGSNNATSPTAWETAYRVFPVFGAHTGLSVWLQGGSFLSRLRSLIEDITFLPSIGEVQGGRFGMLTPKEGRILPSSLASAFLGKSHLQPLKLFGDRVVDTTVLGPRAKSFLEGIKMLQLVSGSELAAAWGTQRVGEWVALLLEKDRDTALSRLLMAMPLENEFWGGAEIVCLPTESGEYTCVAQARRLPPDWNIVVGEEQIRALLNTHLPDPRVTVRWTFDELVRKSWSYWDLLQIPQVKLDEVVRAWWKQMPETGLSADQVESVLHFTCWIQDKQRVRRALVQRVLARDSGGALLLLEPCKTLLTDPYAGAHRRRLFPGMPVVSEFYFQRVPRDLEWRSFFEQGADELQPVGRAPIQLQPRNLNSVLTEALLGSPPPERRATYSRGFWERSKSIAVDSRSYVHIDAILPPPVQQLFEPDLSSSDAQIMADWLADNLGTLGEHRSQRLLYIPRGCSHIAEQALFRSASWVTVLRDTRWVMGRDGSGPHRPADALLAFDDTRPETPVADLSENIVSVLSSAGVRFGSNVPRAASIRVLQVRGATASMDDLEDMLDACLADAEQDRDARVHLQRILETIPLLPVSAESPLLDGAQRATTPRCVLLSGPGRRSGLDWIAVASDFAAGSVEARIFQKVRDVQFIAEQTTADQCIDFLEWVWRNRPEADRVRQLLPRAYAYLAADLGEDEAAAERWKRVLGNAAVYTLGRQWKSLAGSERVYHDDLGRDASLFIPRTQIATPGHLGDAGEGVELLKLPRLSASYRVHSHDEGSPDVPPAWQPRLDALRKTLLELCSTEYGGGNKVRDFAAMTLKRVVRISESIVHIDSGDEQATIEIEARDPEDGVVVVAGEPEDFAGELCRIIIEDSGITGPKADDIAKQVSVLLTIIDSPRFEERFQKFRRRCRLPDLSPEPDEAGPDPNPPEDEEKDPVEDLDEGTTDDLDAVDPIDKDDAEGDEDDPDPDEVDHPPRKISPGGGRITGKRAVTGDPKPTTGGVTRGHTATDRENLLAYYTQQIRSLKATGMIPPGTGDAPADQHHDLHTDVEFRNAVVAYEAQHGRFAYLKNATEVGHDIDSFDAPSSSSDRALIRRIEVKGRTSVWEKDETVELSRPQFTAADAHKVEDGITIAPDFDYWLYVVERVADGKFRVLPICNPSRKTAKFEVRGGTWRAFAVEPGEVSPNDAGLPSAQDMGRPRVPGRRSLLDLKKDEE